MVFKYFYQKTTASVSLFLCSALSVFAQKAGLEISRAAQVERNMSVMNVAVDASNKKWAANAKGIYEVKSADVAELNLLQPGEANVLSYPGGNAYFIWPEALFRQQAKTQSDVSAAWYDAKNETLWIGTEESGLFQFKTKPQLQLVDKYTSANSKLKSNNITIIFQDKSGRMWVGCDEGLMFGLPGRWKSDLINFDVRRVREFGSEIYVLADQEISKTIGGDKWTTIALDAKKLENDIKDFDIDKNGKLWIVSGVLTQYDLLGDSYQIFSGPEYYTSEYGSRIAVDQDEAVWVGTEDKGLYIVDKADAMALVVLLDKGLDCNGNGKDAEIRAKLSGGTPPYDYKWTGGLLGDNPKNVGPGSYAVTVTDSKGKARSGAVTVADTRMKLTAKQKKSATGPGKADGTAEVDIAGNVSGISVLWDNGESLVTAVKLTAGTHTVTVTNSKGCSASASVLIQENADPLALNIEEKTGVRCTGGKDAALNVKVSGGKAPYRYEWSNPAASGAQPAGLGSGEYQLTVTDAAGLKTTATFNIRQPEPLAVSVAVQASASTGNADGKALGQVKGGSSPYTYRWGSGENGAEAVKLASGKQKLIVSDANGCTASADFEINENILPLTVRIEEKKAIRCNSMDRAGLAVQVSGGKGPYQYQWSNPALSGPQADTPAGEYQLTVTDALGTVATTTVSVKQPERLVASILVQTPASVGKADGIATAQPNGGSGSYTYQWDTGETGVTAQKLNIGKHSVTVLDANGCATAANINITENILPLSVALTEKAGIKCPGEKTAALTVTVSGGKSPYQYAWNSPGLSGDQPAGLFAGTYQLTVTDAGGNNTTAAVTVKQPETLVLTLQAQAPASTGNADGKALAQAKGGSGSYTFKWDNGETGATAAKLTPGKRSVTATDANGCTTTASVEISENILPLSASIAETAMIKCSGDKAAALAVTVAGGKGPYQYAWSNPALRGDRPSGIAAGEYQLTVSDAAGGKTNAVVSVKQPEDLSLKAVVQAPASTNNADGKAIVEVKGGTGNYAYKWDNGENAAAAARLAPGKRSVTVTDANGCTATAEVEVSENIQPLSVSILEKAGIKCGGEKTGTLAVTVSGGKAPFQYQWNNATLSGDQPTGIPAGAYQVLVTDAAGNNNTAKITLNQPPAMEASAQVQAPAGTNKADGKALVQVKGGTGAHQFKWDNGETTANALKLTPGKHSVTVTDANGCTAAATVDISENIQPLAVSVAEKAGIKCAGDKTAALAVSVSGGKGPYQYAWNNPALSGDQPANVAAGDYQLTVSDAAGGKTSATLRVKQPEALYLNAVAQTPASANNADGKALAEVKGGAGNYAYKWDNGESAAVATKLAPGKRSVTVTDANGCAATASVDVSENILPLAINLVEKTSIKCAGVDKAALAVQISGGKGPFQYQWNNAALSGGQASGLESGAYAVTVTDAQGKTSTASAEIKAPAPLSLELTRNLGSTTERSNDGKAAIAFKGGTAPVSILWDTKQSTAAVSRLALGKHGVTVTDANGCTQSLEFETAKRILPELTGAIENGQTIRMRLLNFETNSSDIQADAYPVLDELYDFLVINSKVVIEVGGHTNNQPSDSFADRLSTARAKAVADYLTGKGIDLTRVEHKGYGKRYPIASNLNPEGRNANQRVEIKILKTGKE